MIVDANSIRACTAFLEHVAAVDGSSFRIRLKSLDDRASVYEMFNRAADAMGRDLEWRRSFWDH